MYAGRGFQTVSAYKLLRISLLTMNASLSAEPFGTKLVEGGKSMSVDWHFMGPARLIKVELPIDRLIVPSAAEGETEAQRQEITEYYSEHGENASGEPDPVLRYHLRLGKR